MFSIDYTTTEHSTPNNSTYIKKVRVMNKSEKMLFAILQKYLRNDCIILSKVRIEDFVNVNESVVINKNVHWGLRNRIKSRHIDFLICDNTTTEPLLAIELDGKSHLDAKRQSRDQFVNEVYNGCNLPIEHICVGTDFEEEAIRIKNILIEKYPESVLENISPLVKNTASIIFKHAKRHVATGLIKKVIFSRPVNNSLAPFGKILFKLLKTI